MKFSVITVSLNSAATIGATIESLLSQNYSDWEHIIVDGGSTDGTLDIIRSYAERYAGRLHLVSEPDEGLYHAMNKGIRLAAGDVIGFLNSDDRYAATDILSAYAQTLAHTSIDAVYADVNYVHGTHIVRRYSSRRFSRRKMLMGYMPAHPTFYARRSVYERFGVYDCSYRIAADFECMLRMIYYGRIATRYIPRVSVIMAIGGISSSGWRSHRIILADHYRAYRRHHLWAAMLLDPLRYPLKLLRL